MTTDDKIKNRRELAQIYLVITTLLIAIKQGAMPQNLSFTINQTSATLINSTENTQLVLLYCFLFLCLLGILSFYTTPHFNEKISALLIGISFSIIIYFCMFEQIIETKINPNIIQYSLILFEFIIGIILYFKLKSEGENYQIHISKWEKIISTLAFLYILYINIIDPKSLMLLIITVLMEIITTLAFTTSPSTTSLSAASPSTTSLSIVSPFTTSSFTTSPYTISAISSQATCSETQQENNMLN